jgi:hypothetical protein
VFSTLSAIVWELSEGEGRAANFYRDKFLVANNALSAANEEAFAGMHCGGLITGKI